MDLHKKTINNVTLDIKYGPTQINIDDNNGGSA